MSTTLAKRLAIDIYGQVEPIPHDWVGVKIGDPPVHYAVRRDGGCKCCWGKGVVSANGKPGSMCMCLVRRLRALGAPKISQKVPWAIDADAVHAMFSERETNLSQRVSDAEGRLNAILSEKGSLVGALTRARGALLEEAKKRTSKQLLLQQHRERSVAAIVELQRQIAQHKEVLRALELEDAQAEQLGAELGQKIESIGQEFTSINSKYEAQLNGAQHEVDKLSRRLSVVRSRKALTDTSIHEGQLAG